VIASPAIVGFANLSGTARIHLARVYETIGEWDATAVRGWAMVRGTGLGLGWISRDIVCPPEINIPGDDVFLGPPTLTTVLISFISAHFRLLAFFFRLLVTRINVDR